MIFPCNSSSNANCRVSVCVYTIWADHPTIGARLRDVLFMRILWLRFLRLPRRNMQWRCVDHFLYGLTFSAFIASGSRWVSLQSSSIRFRLWMEIVLYHTLLKTALFPHFIATT